MDMTEILLLFNTLLVVCLIGLVYLLARYIGDFIGRIQSIRGIEIGSLQIDDNPPSFREFDYNGNKIVSSQLFKDKKTLLLFVKSTCPICKSILDKLHEIQSNYDLNFVIINSDETLDDKTITDRINDGIVYIKSGKLSQSFSVQSVPHAVLVNTQSKVDGVGPLKNQKSLVNLLLNA
ncbi:MAG TPA: thioredoxin-like domain-containing protein [Bacillales bacterium]|nr:thioredoxin-like domain-containing protein [Bacillales bacterium]